MWLRLYVETPRDQKVRRLAPEHRWLWIVLLCMAKQSPEPGKLLIGPSPATVEDIADEAKLPADVVREGLDAIERLGMIDRQGEVVIVTAWDKRQYASDLSTDRTRRWRMRRRADATDSGANVVTSPKRSRNVLGNVPETDQNTDTDTEIPPLPPQGGGARAHLSESFETFWRAYPRKVSKQEASRAWFKLAPDAALCSRIMAALERHRQSRQWIEDGGRFIPHASTWLNQRRWEDEPEPARPANPNRVFHGEGRLAL